MRKVAFLFVLALVFFSLILPVSAQDDRTLVWDRWDVRIDNVDVTRNQFTVTESYEISFDGRFSFGTASIPYTNLEDITDISVSEAGRELRRSCSEDAGTYCVNPGASEVNITYYFTSPIRNASQSFEIRYTVEGALRIYEGGDQLWWTAIPEEHFGFPIRRSTITVVMPRGNGPREGVDPVETYGAPATIQVSGSTITATASREIGGNESFEIRVQYSHNPNARVSGWQAQFDEDRAFQENVAPLANVGSLALSLLLGLGGILGMFGLHYVRGRDPEVGPVPTYLTDPPSDLRPAVVGTLLDERVDTHDVISTLIDLAARGYVVIEESQTEGLFGLGGKSTFSFKLTDQSTSDLLPYEQQLLQTFFANQLERSMESLQNRFYVSLPSLQKGLYTEAVNRGLFASSPDSVRTLWGALATGALFLGAGVFVLLVMTDQTAVPALFCIPIAVMAVGVLGLIVGQHMPAKTQKGAEEAAKWRAFREYLRNLEKYDTVDTAAAKFEEFLPFAIAFGLEKSWIRRFADVPTMRIPRWYYPVYMGGPYSGGYTAGSPYRPPSSGGNWPGELAQAPTGGNALDRMSGGVAAGLMGVSNGLSRMLDSTARAMTSVPQQSSSSGRWSSGGRSWSGGGFSGGGSSGGGSRGFG
jgi:uncharacterized membrane protein YgcG